MHRVTFKIEKQPPAATIEGSPSDNLELFHGIGNTLGFDLTGGVDFSMPITIFHVKEGSRADIAGLKLGDSIVTINNVDTSKMTLQEANNVLEQAAQQDVKLGITKFDEIDESNPEKKLTIHEILLKEAHIEKAEKKSWHPIVWPHPEKIQTDMLITQKELPHKRVIRNLRRLLTEIADKPEERDKHIENLLLILPRGSADPLNVIRPKPEKPEGAEEDFEEEEEQPAKEQEVETAVEAKEEEEEEEEE